MKCTPVTFLFVALVVKLLHRQSQRSRVAIFAGLELLEKLVNMGEYSRMVRGKSPNVHITYAYTLD